MRQILKLDLDKVPRFESPTKQLSARESEDLMASEILKHEQ